jgi:hypothetical protein
MPTIIYPTAVYQTAEDRLVVFVVGVDGHLYDKSWSGKAWVWEDQGTPPGTTVACTVGSIYQPTLDRLVVFVLGTNGHLYDKYWNRKAWIWEDQGTPSTSTIVAAAGTASVIYQPTLDRIVVFVIADDGHLYDKYSDGKAWVWQDQGLPGGTQDELGDPSVVYASGSEEIHSFSGGEGSLYDKVGTGQHGLG